MFFDYGTEEFFLSIKALIQSVFLWQLERYANAAAACELWHLTLKVWFQVGQTIWNKVFHASRTFL